MEHIVPATAMSAAPASVIEYIAPVPVTEFGPPLPYEPAPPMFVTTTVAAAAPVAGLFGVSHSSSSRVRRASASDGAHRASAGSERGTSTSGRVHRASARRSLRSAGSCGGVSHSSFSRARGTSTCGRVHHACASRHDVRDDNRGQRASCGGGGHGGHGRIRRSSACRGPTQGWLQWLPEKSPTWSSTSLRRPISWLNALTQSGHLSLTNQGRSTCLTFLLHTSC